MIYAAVAHMLLSMMAIVVRRRHEISSRAEGTRASRKGLLDGARDPPSFSAWVLPDSPECVALRADMKGD